MTKRVAVAVVAALALSVQPALARGSRGGGGSHGGGGGRAGGGHSRGGYAVPRGGGSGGHAAPGSVTSRQPGSGGYRSYRPDSGGSAAYGSGRYRSDGYSRYRSDGYRRSPSYRYGRYYRPYSYPYYGRGRGYYYGSSWGFYLGLGPYAYGAFSYGWPYSYGWYSYPYDYPYAYAYPYAPTTHVYVEPQEAPIDGEREPAEPEARGSDSSVPNTGRVRLEVRPDDATVYVDDEFWGLASESHLMTLRAGRHSIELVRPGFDVVRRDVDVARGESTDLLVELQRR